MTATLTVTGPCDAVLAVLDRLPGALTTQTIAGLLAADGYKWPGRDYDRPTVDRVYATLRAMEKQGRVERVPGQSPIRWRRPR